MSIALAPSSAQKEIATFLELVVNQLNEYGDLDEEWTVPIAGNQAAQKQRLQMRFAVAAASASQAAVRFDEPFRLAVVGEFNAGKSALINALLGRANLVTEGATPTTGAVTELWWSEDESGTVVNSAREPLFEGTIEGAILYADQRSPQGESIAAQGARVVLRLDIPLLRNLVILDTPGLGSNSTDDTVTMNELENADAAIIAVSGSQPGAETTIRLAERLRLLERKMIVVVTRIDQVSDRAAVLDLVSEAFAGVSEGEPIGLASPEVIAAQMTLAQDDGDSEKTKFARQTLIEDGFASLRSRVEAELQLGTVRSEHVLKNVGRNLKLLAIRAGEQAASVRTDLKSVDAEKSEAERYVQDVLTPKVHFVASKIDEIVELHVKDFMSDLSAAVDTFIDSVSDGGMGLGARALVGKVSPRARQRLGTQLRQEFDTIFPESRYSLLTDQIQRAVDDLIQYEWKTVAVFKPEDGSTYNPVDVGFQITDEIGKFAALQAAQVLAWLSYLFIPGAALAGPLAMVLNTGSEGRTDERVVLVKQTAKTRLRSEGRQLTEKLTSQFRDVNVDVLRTKVDEARQHSSQREQQRIDLLEVVARWESAASEMDRLIDLGGEQARLGAGR